MPSHSLRMESVAPGQFGLRIATGLPLDTSSTLTRTGLVEYRIVGARTAMAREGSQLMAYAD